MDVTGRQAGGAKGIVGCSLCPHPALTAASSTPCLCHLPGEGSFVRSSVQSTNPGQTGRKRGARLSSLLAAHVGFDQVLLNKHRTSHRWIKSGDACLIRGIYGYLELYGVSMVICSHRGCMVICS